MEHISKAQKTVLAQLARNLFSRPYSPDEDTDWDEVIKESRLQAVQALVFQNFKGMNLEPELREKVEKALKQNTFNYLRCSRDHAYLHSLMTKNNIPYCMIKGVVSASYYPEPLLRAMGDVDFYVHPDDIDRAVRVLEHDGFERQGGDHPVHIAFCKEGTHCEMHFAPVSMPDGKAGEIYGEYWENIRESSHTVSDGFAEYRAPTDFHHVLITLAHIKGHLVSVGIGLRHVCDFAVFVNAFSEEEFVSLFESKLKRVGLWRFAQLLGLAASVHMGLPYQSWMGDDLETANALMEDILSGGNFGRKDKQRRYVGMFLSDRGKKGYGTNRFAQLFLSLHHGVRRRWKIVEKIPLLYPVGWVYFSLRYFVELLLCKRNLDVSDTLKQSEKRRSLYQKIGFFEPEE